MDRLIEQWKICCRALKGIRQHIDSLISMTPMTAAAEAAYERAVEKRTELYRRCPRLALSLAQKGCVVNEADCTVRCPVVPHVGPRGPWLPPAVEVPGRPTGGWYGLPWMIPPVSVPEKPRDLIPAVPGKPMPLTPILEPPKKGLMPPRPVIA